MQIFKCSIKYIAIFLAAVLLMTGLLVLSAGIPQAAIRENMLESAEFLCEGELFGEVIPGVAGSKIDRYADSILLGIAWQYDSEESLESVMLASYYHTSRQNENRNLLDAVESGYPANQQYLRYWHGSIAFVRPLLLFLSLSQIYALNAALLGALTLWLLGTLMKRRAYIPALGIAIGVVLTGSWFVPLSLEYTWVYLVMLIVSIIGVKLCYAGKQKHMGTLFLLTGMVTNYLDFLTTETLTLLIPLLLVLWLDLHEKTEPIQQTAQKAGKAVAAWTAGYGCMWATKWILASMVLRENALPYVTEHIQERIGGDIGIGFWQYCLGALLHNVKCLFPLEYGGVGLFAAAVMVFFAAYIGYVYHRKQISRKRIALYLIIGLIPYVRYLVFHNHAYLHYFFTYRAQMATIAALVMILEELTEWRWRKGANTGKRKP